MDKVIGIGVFLLVLWVLGWIVFKIAGFFIHVLLLVALVMLIAAGWRKLRS